MTDSLYLLYRMSPVGTRALRRDRAILSRLPTQPYSLSLSLSSYPLALAVFMHIDGGGGAVAWGLNIYLSLRTTAALHVGEQPVGRSANVKMEMVPV